MTDQDTATAPQMQTLTDVPKWTGYSSLDDLPFRIFRDCLIDHALEKLVISGTPDLEELADLWLRLYSEYHKLSGNTSMDAILQQVWERDCKKSVINVVKSLASQLQDGPDDVIAECLTTYGYSMPKYAGDDDVYEGHLNRITAQLKGAEHEVKQAQKILEGLQGDELTKNTFQTQLVTLSRHYKFPIKLNDLTTAEYCAYLSEYRKEAELLKNKQDAE